MIVLLSPAKTLDFERKPVIAKSSQPRFLDDTLYLVAKLKKLSVRQIQTLPTLISRGFRISIKTFTPKILSKPSWLLPEKFIEG